MEIDRYERSFTAVSGEIARFAPGADRMRINEEYLCSLPDALWQLEGLRHLSIHSDNLTEIPRHIARLGQLETLETLCAPIATLPEEIGDLKNLRELTISDLAELPPQIGQLQHLDVLDLRGLRVIPPEIGRLGNLRRLSLVGDAAEPPVLPAEVWELTNLRELFLDACYVEEIPAGIENLDALRTLCFHDGVYGSEDTLTLPETLWNLTRLESLYLPMSDLATLPAAIGRMSELRVLDLGTCEVSRLPPEISLLHNLERLDLAGTRTATIEDEIRLPPKLSELRLSRRG